jgi:hypothetical protein
VLRKPYAPAFGFKNSHFLPQRGKKCSVSGFARGQALSELMSVWLKSGLDLDIRIRPDPNSAFKRFFPPKSLRRVLALNTLGQSLRVFDTLSLIFPETPL